MREPDFVDECYAGKDLSLLKKLTLVIPTYNRNYYLSRCLWYHAHFPFGEIIIADSSPEEKKVVNRETVAKVREQFGANVRYLEYEPETEKYGGDIYRKWGDAVQHVNTEYDVICTDKEFLIPTTLYKCIEYLNKYDEVNTIEGVYYFAKKNLLLKNEYYAGYADKESLMDINALTRLLQTLNTTFSSANLLAVRRSINHKYIYNKICEYNLDDIRFGEITVELLTIINSKTKYLNDLPYNFRDTIDYHNISGVKSSESSNLRSPYLNQYDNITYNNKINSFFISIKKELIYNNNSISNMDFNEKFNEEIIQHLINRGFYGKSKIVKLFFETYPLIGYLWWLLPTNLTSSLQKRFHYPISNHAVPKKELDLILMIINNKYGKNDDLPYF